MDNYTINSKNLSLSVNPIGAELRSFIANGIEFIWQRDPEFWAGSAPVLFPIVGELKNKTTLIDGKPYTMPKHGVVRYEEFKLKNKTENSILLWYKSNSKTLKQYPYKFGLGVEFSLKDNGFTQTFIIENKTSMDMPFVVGAHPAFNVPMFGDKFEDYSLVFEKVERQGTYRMDDDGIVDDSVRKKIFNGTKTLPLDHSYFDDDALMFENLNSKSIKLVNGEGKGIRIDFADFNYLGIWQCKAKKPQYLCLEPWTGMNDCYSEDGVYKNKKGIRFINPKDSLRLSYTVTVL